MNPETGFDGTGLIILAAIAALILVVVIRKRNKNKPTKNPNEPETGKEPRESTKKKTSKLEQNRRDRELQEKKDNAKRRPAGFSGSRLRSCSSDSPSPSGGRTLWTSSQNPQG